MNFIVDAQLPRRCCAWFSAAGHDAVHTLDLPARNRTPDFEILRIAEAEDRVVVSKDDDFVKSFLIHGRPVRLLFVATGNITNNDLQRLIALHLDRIVEAMAEHHLVELGRTALIIRA